MTFAGMEKLSLVDYDGMTACTVFTAGCNFRCPFCQNAALVTDVPLSFITEEDVFDHLQRRHAIIDALCITGGEPTLHKELPDFIRRVRERFPHIRVKLDTNGTRPAMLNALLEEGLLDYVAMDIKNCREKYTLTAGVNVCIDDIESSIKRLLAEKDSKNFNFEFRTTVVAEFHTAEDMQKIGEWLEGAPRYYLQMFRDRGTNIESGLHAIDENTLLSFAQLLQSYIPSATVRGIF